MVLCFVDIMAYRKILYGFSGFHASRFFSRSSEHDTHCQQPAIRSPGTSMKLLDTQSRVSIILTDIYMLCARKAHPCPSAIRDIQQKRPSSQTCNTTLHTAIYQPGLSTTTSTPHALIRQLRLQTIMHCFSGHACVANKSRETKRYPTTSRSEQDRKTSIKMQEVFDTRSQGQRE